MGVIAYMLTWTTYGTWVQGDRRGWVRDGTVCRANPALEDANRRQMKNKPVTLTKVQRMSARRAIVEEATKLNQRMFALVVCNNHVHIVAQNIDLPIGQVASHYKNAVRLTLQGEGFQGKLWTRGFDKRYCMNKEELAEKVAYVRNHRNADAEIRIAQKAHPS
jgi:hypothetical protein